jgi:hypothetical protein
MSRETDRNNGISIFRATCQTEHCPELNSRASSMCVLWQHLRMLHPWRLCKGFEHQLSMCAAWCIYINIGLTMSHNRKTFADPITAWDCETKEEVLLRSYALLFAGDNPMQAELCSCAGLNSNYFCRSCKAGGTQDYKRSDQGFTEMLKVSDSCSYLVHRE